MYKTADIVTEHSG